MAILFGLLPSYVKAEKIGYTYYDNLTNTSIQYYLDENGAPYILQDDGMQYVALPLPSLEVTDEDKLAELNAALENQMTARSAPTNYVDISSGVTYTMRVDFSATVDCVTTPVLKMNREHVRILASITDVSKPIWVVDKDVTLVLYYYDGMNDRWYSIYYIGQDFTTNPLNVQFPLSVYEFIKFDVRESSPITSCKFNVHSSARW